MPPRTKEERQRRRKEKFKVKAEKAARRVEARSAAGNKRAGFEKQHEEARRQFEDQASGSRARLHRSGLDRISGILEGKHGANFAEGANRASRIALATGAGAGGAGIAALAGGAVKAYRDRKKKRKKDKDKD
jgi:hypothetical protein